MRFGQYWSPELNCFSSILMDDGFWFYFLSYEIQLPPEHFNVVPLVVRTLASIDVPSELDCTRLVDDVELGSSSTVPTYSVFH